MTAKPENRVYFVSKEVLDKTPAIDPQRVIEARKRMARRRAAKKK